MNENGVNGLCNRLQQISEMANASLRILDTIEDRICGCIPRNVSTGDLVGKASMTPGAIETATEINSRVQQFHERLVRLAEQL